MDNFVKKRIIVILLTFSISAQPAMGSSYVPERLRNWFSNLDTTIAKAYSNTQGTFIGSSILNLISTYGGAMIAALVFGKTLQKQQENAAQSLLTHSIKPVYVTDTTLKDYIGVPPAVDILVDQIKYREVYKRLKAPFTKGILLTGNPGTGKSFLARAIAGEVQVPFFSVSGTEFSQPFVGTSALMIRNLFKNAKLAALNSPAKLAIIFIDELDAIGGRGSAYMSGSPSGIVQQLLIEIDGFNKINTQDLDLSFYEKTSIEGKPIELPEIAIVMFGATNVPENIDSALKRPGRFDNIIEVGNPDAINREKIAALYLTEYSCEKNVEASRLAIVTDGMTPAEIKAVFQEAARDAAKNRQEIIKIKNFCRALFDARGGKEIPNYERKVLETLITMYPCDQTVTVDGIVKNITYANAQEIVDIFEDTYVRVQVMQGLEKEGNNSENQEISVLISLNDLKDEVKEESVEEDTSLHSSAQILSVTE